METGSSPEPKISKPLSDSSPDSIQTLARRSMNARIKPRNIPSPETTKAITERRSPRERATAARINPTGPKRIGTIRASAPIPAVL